MKLFMLLLLIGFVLASATVFSQNTRFTLEAENKPVENILREIEQQSDYRFFFQREQVDVERKINLKVLGQTVEEILPLLFNDQKVEFEMRPGNLILIKPKKELPPVQNQGQQSLRVSGIVTDESGDPLPGVTILEKGTNNGTVTGINGEYVLENLNDDAVLVFSFVGMRTQEIEVNRRRQIDVAMQMDAYGIEEVIAVGYGTQKKVNLTGSVANVNLENQESRAVTQSSQLLAGMVSGVTVMQPGGQPGKNASAITIRGMGTFSRAGNEPLVLVDGIASSIDNVDPNDIESISVLKDAASAAIYGSRAANGVILVTTKRGAKGENLVTYNAYAGWQHVRELPENISSWEHAELLNEAYVNLGQGKVYTDEEIQKFRSGSDPDNYPNIDHLDDLLGTGSGFQTNHNLGFTSSSDKNSYLFSVGYLEENGLVAKSKYKRYNMLFNFDSNLAENLVLGVNINANKSATNEPIRFYYQELANLVAYAQQVPNFVPGRKSDGTYGYWHNYGIEAIMDSHSFRNRRDGYFLGSMDLKWELFRGFSLTGKMGYNYNNYVSDSYQAEIVYDEFYTYGPNRLSVASSENQLLTLQALADYDFNTGDNAFHFLAGFSQEEFRYDLMDAFRDNFPNDLLYELNAGSAANMQNSGTASEWALRSYFGRLNYNYDEKYLFEANIRYDGTSRFPSASRWGIFPSFSAGWRISEEAFVKDNLSGINNFKIRASWGLLGNQNIGNYPYQNTITFAKNYVFGGDLYPGAYIQTVPNSDIEWERTRIINIGLDLSVLDNRLSVVTDFFKKYTTGILYNISASDVLGMLPSEVNAGEVENTGFEVLVNYRPRIGKLRLNISPNFSYVKNEILKLSDVERDIAKGLFVGEPLNAVYGYVADGLFVDQADIEDSPVQPYNVQPGFIKYRDISGPNGVPDGVVDPEYDRTVIASTFPKFNYGMLLGMNYGPFDFALQLQGIAGRKNLLSGWYQQTAFVNGGTAQRWQYDNRWTTENPDPNARYPKVVPGSNDGLRYPSTYWLLDASFLRVENLQLGYNLSPALLRDTGINKLRIYLNAENLYSFDSYYQGWDPEMTSGGGNGTFYPITATYSIGVNVIF